MAEQAAVSLNGWTAVGSYTVPTEVISAAAQVQVLALLDDLGTLITGQTQTTQASMASPDFQNIPPSVTGQLLAEIATLKACIDAAPAA